MWTMYLEKHEQERILSMKANKDCKPHVKYDHYNRLFNTISNLSFGTLRTDTCLMRDSLKLQLDSCTANNECRVLATKQELHLRKADAFYDDLKEKSSLSKKWKCLDYQQNLPVPLLSINRNTLSKYVRSLYLFTDNCAGQNKNVVWFLLTLVNSKFFSIIVDHLPERGHSFLPRPRAY
ncbi:hypothetical protein PR048_021752 [Dryococelus australis]|uniref:Uncharacterized protein n=1 Tax=Dryococelus australis TaxID=614101 RepID=A0ABQ9GZA2_9NEOP|nr:hypothetical protein PR048_021752 [Dryococelus australis]